MKVVAIGAEKGGVGKSTTTLYLAARAAERIGCADSNPKVAIVDRDHSRWLTRMWTLREDLQRPDVLLMPAHDLPGPDSGIELVLIDTPPGREALPSLREAQTIVVPTPPNTWGVIALKEYMQRVEEVTRTVAPGMRLVAVLPTMLESRAPLHQERLREIGVIAAMHQPPLLVLPPVRRRRVVEDTVLSSTEYNAAAEELFRHGTI